MDRPVIYTANFGSYSLLKPPPLNFRQHFDFICFTDNPSAISDGWQIVFVDRSGIEARLFAKSYKILPHLCLPHHSISIWIDSNLELTSHTSLSEMLCFFHSLEKPIILFRHDSRDCLYDEASVCLKYSKDVTSIIDRQIRFYRDSKFPAKFGLFAGRVIIRKHFHPNSIYLMMHWWHQVRAHSIRDQISLPFSVGVTNSRSSLLVLPSSNLHRFITIHRHLRYSTARRGMNLFQVIRYLKSFILYQLSWFFVALRRLLKS